MQPSPPTHTHTVHVSGIGSTRDEALDPQRERQETQNGAEHLLSRGVEKDDAGPARRL